MTAAEPQTRAGAPVDAGDELELEVGPVAHGGHMVARHDGRVVFVRHALPGERVVARVTEAGASARYLRADAVGVLRASPDRVAPRCPHAHPGGCGGCDFQHASLPAQRALKAEVVREQLSRLGGVDNDVVVEAVAGDDDGLGWRTRVRYTVDGSGRAGLRRHRSHDVEPLEACPLSHPLVADTGALARAWPGVRSVTVAVSPASGGSVVAPDGHPDGAGRLREVAAGRTWRVSGTGFWQVHPGAAEALVDAVRGALVPRTGEHVVDLYAGVGLFAGSLAADVGPGGRVDAVEHDAGALRDARRNLHDLPHVRLHHASVVDWLGAAHVRRCDLVVLDPPRAGAGRAAVEAVARLGARAVAYVACDPAALGRDVGTFRALGWRLSRLRAFDLFPMTHHVECVAVLEPAGATGGRELS